MLDLYQNSTQLVIRINDCTSITSTFRPSLSVYFLHRASFSLSNTMQSRHNGQQTFTYLSPFLDTTVSLFTAYLDACPNFSLNCENFHFLFEISSVTRIVRFKRVNTDARKSLPVVSGKDQGH